jgi:hypothetical protein
MESNPKKQTSVIRPEIKMAKESIDVKTVREQKITQVRRHPNIFVRYKKVKKGIRPIITGYGTGSGESLVQDMVGIYAEIQKELNEKGYIVAPYKTSRSTSQKGQIQKKED